MAPLPQLSPPVTIQLFPLTAIDETKGELELSLDPEHPVTASFDAQDAVAVQGMKLAQHDDGTTLVTAVAGLQLVVFQTLD